jgi:hypothetical protein
MRRTRSIIVGAILVPVAALSLLLGSAGAATAIANGEPVPDGKYRFSVKLTMTGIPTASGGKAQQRLLRRADRAAVGDHRRALLPGRQQRPGQLPGGRPDHRDGRPHRPDRHRTATRPRSSRSSQSPTADVSLARLETPVTGVRPMRSATAARDRRRRPGHRLRLHHQRGPGAGHPAADRPDDGGVAERFGDRACGGTRRSPTPPRARTTRAPRTSWSAARRGPCWSRWSATARAARTPRWRTAPARTTSPAGSATASGRPTAG